MSEIKTEIKPNADGSYTITDAHSTADVVRWLLTQDSKQTILYLLNETLAQPEQEPVAFICEFYADEGHPFVSFEPVTHGTNTPLYSTPPQRKPLTDEEIILIVAECAASHQHTDIHFARAIERAHGIKELV